MSTPSSRPEAWSPSRAVADNLPDLRERAHMSQRALTRALADVGVSITHPTVAKTETGDRAVTLDEAFAFAVVLNVNPARLMLPRTAVDVAVAPDVVVGPSAARMWFRGQQPLPGQDARTFAQERHDDELLAQRETSLRVIIGHVQKLVTATIREDRDAMADAVDAINTELDHLRGDESSETGSKR